MIMLQLAFVALFLVPGFLLTALLAPALPRCQKLPVAFTASVGLLALPAVGLLNLHAPLIIVGWVALLFTLSLTLLWLRRKAIGPWRPALRAEISALQSLIASPLFLACCLAAAATLYLFFSTAIIRDFGDHWFYLHFIRHYLDFPLDPALNPLVGIEPTLTAHARAAANGWWVLLALLVRLSGAPLPLAYWIYLPPLLMVVSLFAFYGLAWELFEERRAALMAILLQLLLYLSSIGSHDWIGQGFFTRIAEDKYLVWLVLLPVTLTLTLRFVKYRERRVLYLLIVSLIALGLTHPFGVLQWAFSLACFIPVHLWALPEKRGWRKAIVWLAPLLALLLIPLLQTATGDLTALTYLSPAEVRTPPNDTHLILLSAEENRYLLHPHLVAHPLTLLAIFLAPLLLFRLRKGLAAQFLSSMTLIPLLLLYNGWTAPLLGRLFSPLLLWRLTWLLPVSLVLAYVMSGVLKTLEVRLQSRFSASRLSGAAEAGLLLAVTLLAIALSPYLFDGHDLLLDYGTRQIDEEERELLDYVRQNNLSGVVLADPALNTLLPAYAAKTRLLTYRIFQAQPAVDEEIERFYRSRWVTEETLDFLQRWQVRYVILEAQQPVTAQISRLPGLFEARYSGRRYALYEIEGMEHPVIRGNEALVRGRWNEAETAFNEALAQDLAPGPAAYGLGQLWLQQGETARAESAFQQAIRYDERYAAAYMALSQLYEEAGRQAAAETQLRKALAAAPANLRLRQRLGDLYLAQGEETAAMAQYRLAVAPATNLADEALALGNLLATKGLNGRAIAAYETVVARESGLSRLAGESSYWTAWRRSLTFDRRGERAEAAYLALGKLHEAEGDMASAEAAYWQIVRLRPTEESGYRALADLFRITKRQSLQLYEKAAALNFHMVWPHLRLAENYLNDFQRDDNRSEDLTSALSVLQRARQMDPAQMETHHLLALAYELNSQPERIEALYREAAETNSWAAWPYTALGQFYLSKGERAAAVIAFNEAIARQPVEAEPYNQLAQCYLNGQEPQKAIQTYLQALQHNRDRAWPHLGLGNAYLAAGETDRALAAYEDGLAQEPDNPDVYLTLGNIYRWNVGRPHDAAGYYRQAVILEPDKADAHIALAAILTSLGDLGRGLEHLEKALVLAPHSGAVYQTAGDIMWQAGKVEEAERYYLQAVERDLQNASAHLGLARIYRRKAVYERALHHAQRAQTLTQSDPISGSALFEQGHIYLALERPDEALAHFLQAIEALPGDPWFQAAAGDFYRYQENDPLQAADYYRRAVELAPEQSVLQAAWGTALYEAGQLDRAMPILERTVALAGQDAAIFLRLGAVFNQAGDWTRVVQLYETAVARGIEDADIYRQLGDAYRALGNEVMAMIQYDKAASLDETTD